MRIFNSKVCVTKSLEHIITATRNSKTFSSQSISYPFMNGMAGLKPDAFSDDTPNSPSLLTQRMEAPHHSLQPSDELKKMYQVLGDSIKSSLDALGSVASSEIDLWEWIKLETTLATSDGIWGPNNPLRRDPRLVESFWDYAFAATYIVRGVLPRIFVRRGIAAREKMVLAFEDYFANNCHETGSILVRNMNSLNERNHVSLNEKARLETVIAMGAHANTIPTAFWAIFNVVSDPVLISRVRKEALNLVKTTVDKNGTTTRSFHMSDLQKSSLMISIVRETLRHEDSGMFARMAAEDFVLDGEHLIRKDAWLLAPNPHIHFDASIWGATVNDFNPDRFTDAKTKKSAASAFLGLGTGANLCPGRYLAITEVSALLLLLVERFYLSPTSGSWIKPRKDLENMPLTVPPPKDKILVNFRRRPTDTGVTWKVLG
ncbi:hypothetical protein BOTCAL_0851g00010 [Botryotinia calthae]|uniref:Cytochrome P450 n=1 Tax=Botryotinia calthae TaxID=38488 RepID=A0A4Y8CHI5_9HELO|nr:hypothetical protein BOTCAL_0851g00010 [Botryotinia calthae]